MGTRAIATEGDVATYCAASAGELTGEGSLLLALLNDAVVAYRRGGRDAGEAARWFLGRGQPSRIPFRTICMRFGFDPRWIWRLLGGYAELVRVAEGGTSFVVVTRRRRRARLMIRPTGTEG